MRHWSRRWGVVPCVVVLMGLTGCQALRSLGFESRGARLARQLLQEKKSLAARNAELEAKLASATMQQKQIETKLTRAEMEVRRLKTQRPQVAARRTSRDQDLTTLMAALRAVGGGTPIVTPNGTRGFRLGSDMLFRPGSCEIKSGAVRGILRKIARIIERFDVIVFIDGHTDSDPLRRTKSLYHDNYGLAAARANAVARLLVSYGAPRTKLITRSFGQSMPIAPNKTAAGKKKNRRVEITFALADAPTTTTAKTP